VDGSCEHGDEPSDFIKFWKIFERCTTGSFSRKLSSMELGKADGRCYIEPLGLKGFKYLVLSVTSLSC
jgi:hypothetical protein